MKCTIPEEINQCPFFVKEESVCRNDKKCSMQEFSWEPKARSEKWFEKYYKR